MADAPSRWPQFARALRKQALMDEMMEAQGVDPLAAVKTGEAYVRARANCRAIPKALAATGSSRAKASKLISAPTRSSSPRSNAKSEGQSYG